MMGVKTVNHRIQAVFSRISLVPSPSMYAVMDIKDMNIFHGR